ncbi:hypothetical protein HYR54_10440 [Candidatus Acetothermia bacterium]|nr:hypothetical protein [Candidatus Acetothermia bacterium]MBI3460258.1 hypothetical protein [Candidatus Acetothermia bacterium]
MEYAWVVQTRGDGGSQLFRNLYLGTGEFFPAEATVKLAVPIRSLSKM